MTNEDLYRQLTSPKTILEWEEVRGNENQNSLIPSTESLKTVDWSAASPWIDTNRCENNFHFFKRNDQGLQAYHSDETLCEQIEFSLPGISTNLANYCDRHKRARLPRPTTSICADCQLEAGR
jgi:hypothetical protein